MSFHIEDSLFVNDLRGRCGSLVREDVLKGSSIKIPGQQSPDPLSTNPHKCRGKDAGWVYLWTAMTETVMYLNVSSGERTMWMKIKWKNMPAASRHPPSRRGGENAKRGI
ncbi:hypothetical protein JOB18_032093 [Solea senegalensis]|uniref:Uncharacterized protein n=1 Tax=Solea senegalensis TaxID=28829 RepID=A0AAV6RPF6_SOLSE|nr:hypothetical protein JOB18_032093 [Solea senegalensis]